MSKSADSGCSTGKPARSTSTVAHELKRIVYPWPTVPTKRDIDFRSPEGQLIVACISSRFEAVLDGYPGTYDWHQLQETWRQELTECPEAQLVLDNVHADVNAELGYATVHLDMDVNFTATVELMSIHCAEVHEAGRWKVVDPQVSWHERGCFEHWIRMSSIMKHETNGHRARFLSPSSAGLV